MSKKPSEFVHNIGGNNSSQVLLQQQTKADRVYKSVYSCINRSELSRGLRISLLSQVPHQAIMLTSFSMTSSMLDTSDRFHRFDDRQVMYKLVTRFGALVLSTTLASAVCYPFDTIKRRL